MSSVAYPTAPVLPFKGGEIVVIDLEAVRAFKPLLARRLEEADLADAKVVSVTLGPLVLIRLKGHITEWLPLNAVTLADPTPPEE